MIQFTLSGPPVPWARAGKSGKRHFTPEPQRKFMELVQLMACAKWRGGGPTHGPVELSVVAVYPWPAKFTATMRARPENAWKITRPDDDNIKKIIQDALTGIAYRDDAQVAAGHCVKIYGDMPRVTVTVRELHHEIPATV